MASSNLDIVMSAKDKASKVIKGVNSSISGLKFGALASVGSAAMGALTGSVSGFASSVIDLGKNFSASMSEVGAISGATGSDLAALEAKAREMGATTKFSATDAADGLKYMAMAGWNTEQMIAGLPPILNLAAASGEDLGTTSDIVTDALTAFGLKAQDAERFTDVLAKTSSNANTNVSMMGETFKYVAPVAGAMGYSVEDTSVAIGLMANSGIKASSAGTALRSMLTNLAKPTDQVQTAMDQLGISLTNSDGSMKSFATLTDDLRGAFSGLTEEQKSQYAATLAGKQGMSGLLAVVNASDDDINKLRDSIENCDGAAAEMAATMNDNLAGDMANLNSAWEEVKLKFFDAAEPLMRGFVQFITGSVIPVIDSFAQALATMDFSGFMKGITDAIRNFDFSNIAGLIPILATVGIVGGGLASKIGNPFSGLLSGGRKSKGLFKSLGTGIGNMVKGVGQGFKAVGQGIGDMISKIEVGFGKMGRSLMTASKAANPVNLLAFAAVILAIGGAITLVATQSEGLSQILNAIGTMIATVATSIGEAIGIVVESVGTAIGNILVAIAPCAEQIAVLVTAFMTGFAQIAEFLPAIIDSISGLFTSLGEGISTAAQGIGQGIATVLNAITPMIAIIADAFVDMVDIIAGAIVQIVQALAPYIPEVTKMVEATSQAIQAVCDSFNTLVSNISPIIESVTNLLDQFGSTVSEILGAAGDVVKDFGQAIRNVLDGVSGIFDSIGNAALNAGKGFDMMSIGLSRLVELGAMDIIGTLGGVATGLGLVAASAGGIGDTGTQISSLASGLVLLAANLTMVQNAAASLPAIVGQFQALSGLSEPMIAASASMTVFGSSAMEMAAGLLGSMVSISLFGSSMQSAASTASSASAGFSTAATAISKVPAAAVRASASLTALGSAGQVAFTQLQTGANAMSTAITQAFTKAQQAATKSLKSITTAMRSAVSDATSAGWSMGSGFSSGLSSGLNRAVSVARSASSSIRSALSSATGSAYSVGLNIGIGLANGMSASLGRVRSVAAQLANAAAEAARAAAKVHSPSRVFMAIGEYIGEGLEIGIESMERAVARASQNLVDIPSATRMAFAGDLGSMNSNLSCESIEEIHIHLDMDGDEIVEKTFRKTGKRIDEEQKFRNRLGGLVGV